MDEKLDDSIVILVKARFEIVGIHRWPDAPDSKVFLCDPHRHKFYFEVAARALHDDREIEAIELGESCRRFVARAFEIRTSSLGEYQLDFGTMSCEQLARMLLAWNPRLTAVSVMEDDEQGASLIRTA